jgi:hypothetical protein
MLAAFCLRLSLGLVAFLPLLPTEKMHPRFFRTQYLTAFGLSIVALFTGPETELQFAVLTAAVLISFCGSISWTLHPAPLGRTVGWIATAIFAIGVGLIVPRQPSWLFWLDGISSGMLVGCTVTTMLVGHSYLISPGLTLRPLMTMLAVGGLCWLARVCVLAVASVPLLVPDYGAPGPNPYWLFIVPRCIVGLGGSLVFGYMSFRAARIGSTQSATGILYVVVVCTIIGELFGIVIAEITGTPA